MSDSPRESARMLAGSTGGTNEAIDATALLINSQQAAELLSISQRTLWSLQKRNAVPSRRIGRSVRYSPHELRAWIAAGCPTDPGASERIGKGVGQ